MSWALLIRHGRTAWNEAGRIQGQTDIGLNEAGRAALAGHRVPGEYDGATWFTSPLRRAIQTAELLGAFDPIEDARLAEMRWGVWEGFTLDHLRASHGAAIAGNEGRGLDFRPEGGESPREVRARLAAWFDELTRAGEPRIGVTHKGVIRAALSLAYDWDMTGRAPVRLDWSCAQVFEVRANGSVAARALNLKLEKGTCRAAS